MKKAILTSLVLLLLLSSLYTQAKKLNINDNTFINNSLKSSNTVYGFDIDIKQARSFSLNPSVLHHENISLGDTLQLDLFSGKEYLSTIKTKTTDVNGTTVLVSKLCDFKFAYCYISNNNNNVLITIDIPELGEKYCTRLESFGNTQYLLQLDELKLDILPDNQISTHQYDSIKNSFAPTSNQTNLFAKKEVSLKSISPGLKTNNMVKVDVLIVYTAAAKKWSDDNEGGINNTISQAIAKANLVAENSNLDLIFNLAHSTVVDYEESGDPELNYIYFDGEPTHSEIDLYRLTEGNIPNVFSIRDMVAADLVMLITKTNDIGGLAWLLNNREGNEAYGFSLVRVQQASGLTTIHEIGHNLGAHHPKEQLLYPGPIIWTNWPENTWSAGWRWKNDDNNFICTLMGNDFSWYYSDGNSSLRIPYFSDPDISYFGNAIGHETDGNNARTIRETKNVVAAYREEQFKTTPTLYTFSVNEISSDSAASGGCVVNEGNSQIIARGLVYSTKQMPTLKDSFTVAGSGIGSFNSNITDLEANKVYYIRAYATNSFGTSYGNQMVYTNSAGAPRDFITRWEIPVGQNKLELILDRSGEVEYLWETIPAGQSGSGSFKKGRGIVEIQGLPEGKTVRISIAPSNLRQLYSYFFLSPLPAVYGPDRENLVDIEQWGTVHWLNMDHAFEGCKNLNISASDLPDLNLVKKMSWMFDGCESLNGPQNINDWNVYGVKDMMFMFHNARTFNRAIGFWDVSNVSTMANMFEQCEAFNQEIEDWNVSNVKDMRMMFAGASSFNQDIGAWDVSNVSNMNSMFSGASSFNQNIENWNVSKVRDMSWMFSYAAIFNQSLNNWDVSSVSDMSNMFYSAEEFNQAIGTWNVSSVTNMSNMFYLASKFNQAIGSWDVSNVIDMSNMFYSARRFNQGIGAWDVSNVENMEGMFFSATQFNENIGSWDVSSVRNMNRMFFGAINFNQAIGAWDVSLVSDMAYMFCTAETFNQNIGAWNVASVQDMYSMFKEAVSFNCNIGSWNLSNIIDLNGMFDDSGIDCKNYGLILTGWSQNPNTRYGRTLGANSMNFDVSGLAGRQNLIQKKYWEIGGDKLMDQPQISGKIFGQENVCQSQTSVKYWIDNVNNEYTYVWNLPEGATESGDQIIYVNYDSTAISGNITVKAVNECSESKELSLYVKVNALPKLTGEKIIGKAKVCKGEKAVNYSIHEIENASSYTWTLPNGTYGESNNSTITINFDSTFISGNIKVKGVNDCGESKELQLNVSVFALPKLSGEIIGKTNFCRGENTIDYSINEIENATSYIWTLPDGAFGESNSSTITITFDSTFISGDIKVKGVNDCLESNEAILPVNVNFKPKEVIDIIGKEIVCDGETTEYSCKEIENATSYIWTLPNNETKTSADPKIMYFVNSSAVSGELKVKGVNSCGESSEISLPIKINPTPGRATEIIGPRMVCTGEKSLIYSCNIITNVDSYFWTLPNGETLNSSVPNITVDADSGFISGDLKVKGMNWCGESNELTFPIIVNSISSDANEINGPEFVCSGDSSLVYSINKIENADYYIWTLPNGQTSFSNTNMIVVDYDSIAVSGELKVKGVNTCDESIEIFLPIYYNLLPGMANQIAGPKEVCLGDTSVIYSCNNIENVDSYLWTLPNGEFITSFDSTITINFSSHVYSGELKVKGINSCSESNEISFSIELKPTPETPQIAIINEVLTSRIEEGNQWYFEGGLIANATEQTYVAQLEGNYYVIVTTDGCSSKPSNTVSVSFTEIEDLINGHKVKVYPNPVSNELTIKINDNSKPINFEIVNAIGQVVLSGNIINETSINTADFNPGVYFVKFENNKRLEFTKVIKN